MTYNMGLPPMGFSGPHMAAPGFAAPPMMHPIEPYNPGMRPLPVINNANQFEQKNNAAPSTTTILWTQEQNRTNNTIRYNWYFRQKTTRDTYYVYEQMSVIIDEVEQFISDLTNKTNAIKSTMSEYSGKIKVIIQAYDPNLHDIKELLPACEKFIQSLNLLNSDDFATHNKEFKANVTKAIYDVENVQIIIHSIENDMKLINSALQQIYGTSRMVQEQKNYVQSLESTSWDNYQKLDELISDSQVRSISSEISNALENAKQIKAFLESDVMGFVTSTANNITHALNKTNSNVENVVKELSLISLKIAELNTLKQQELLKQKQQDELERAEKEEKEELEKKKQEELRKKKILLARPWYQKIYEDKIKGFFHSVSEYKFSNLYTVPLGLIKELSKKPAIPFLLVKNAALDIYDWIGSIVGNLLGNEKNNNKNKKKIITAKDEEDSKQDESKDLVDELQKQAATQGKHNINAPSPQESLPHGPMPMHPGFTMPQNHAGIPPMIHPMGPGMTQMHPPMPMMRPPMPMNRNNMNNRNRRGMGAHPQMVANTSQGPAAMAVMDIQAEQSNQQKNLQKEQMERTQEFQQKNLEKQNEARQLQSERTPMMSTEPMNNNHLPPQGEFGEPEEMNNFESGQPQEFGEFNRNNNQQQGDDPVAMAPDKERPFEQQENGGDQGFNNDFQQQNDPQAGEQGTSGNFDENLLNIAGEEQVGQDMGDDEQPSFGG